MCLVAWFCNLVRNPAVWGRKHFWPWGLSFASLTARVSVFAWVELRRIVWHLLHGLLSSGQAGLGDCGRESLFVGLYCTSRQLTIGKGKKTKRQCVWHGTHQPASAGFSASHLNEVRGTGSEQTVFTRLTWLA